MADIKYSKDGRVAFYPDKHEYYLGDKKLPGVTKLIERYTEPFDKERISKNYAAKHGLIQSEVLAGWKQENDTSLDQGHDTHDLLERFALDEFIPRDEDLKWPKQRQAIKFIQEMFGSGRLKPIESEMIIYNDYLASQIDCIAENPKGEKFILDYKTNKRIDRFSYREKRMKFPFSQYMDCNFYHYSLQVGIYRKLCREYDIKDAFIIYFSEDAYEIIKPAPMKIPDFVLAA